MSNSQRHLILYEENDGSFRIPPNIALFMASGDDHLQVQDGQTHSQSRKRPLQPSEDEAVEYLRYENQIYKKKYFDCLKQLQELNHLTRQISLKLELALRYSEMGINVAIQPPSGACRLIERDPSVMQGDLLRTVSTEGGCSSGSGPHHPNPKASQHIPPKKRPFPENFPENF